MKPGVYVRDWKNEDNGKEKPWLVSIMKNLKRTMCLETL